MKKLVIGATGNIGFYAIRKLKELNENILVASRNVHRARERLKRFGDMEYVEFDFYEDETYLNILQGVTSILLIKPNDVVGVKYIKKLIDLAEDCGIRHITFISTIDAKQNKLSSSNKIEEYLMTKKISYTFLRPNIFMENLVFPHSKEIRALSKILIPAGNSRISMVSAEDVGEVAAVCLSDNTNHINKTYTLTGDIALSYKDVAGILTEVLGRKILYANPSFTLYKTQLSSSGFNSRFINNFILLYTVARVGALKITTRDIENILKRKPITIQEFAYKHKVNWLLAKEYLLNREV